MKRHPFEEHIPSLRRYATALLRDRSRADDLVQDTLERGLKKFSLFRRDSDMRAWLFAIMHNLYVNGVRSAAHVRTVPLGEGPLHEESEIDATPALLDISSALARLEPAQREIILLVGLEQLSYEETARALDIPVGTVMSRLSRARQRFNALISGELVGTGSVSYLRRVE